MPSGRKAILLGVLKEGSSMAKLQWEETDLSVRYYSFIFVHDRIFLCPSLKVNLPSTSNKTVLIFLWFFCMCAVITLIIFSQYFFVHF